MIERESSDGITKLTTIEQEVLLHLLDEEGRCVREEELINSWQAEEQGDVVNVLDRFANEIVPPWLEYVPREGWAILADANLALILEEPSGGFRRPRENTD